MDEGLKIKNIEILPADNGWSVTSDTEGLGKSGLLIWKTNRYVATDEESLVEIIKKLISKENV